MVVFFGWTRGPCERYNSLSEFILDSSTIYVSRCERLEHSTLLQSDFGRLLCYICSATQIHSAKFVGPQVHVRLSTKVTADLRWGLAVMFRTLIQYRSNDRQVCWQAWGFSSHFYKHMIFAQVPKLVKYSFNHRGKHVRFAFCSSHPFLLSSCSHVHSRILHPRWCIQRFRSRCRAKSVSDPWSQSPRKLHNY